MTLEEILKFVSGSGKIPAIGFETIPKIKFTGSDRLPNVSTCDMLITFPRDGRVHPGIIWIWGCLNAALNISFVTFTSTLLSIMHHRAINNLTDTLRA